MYTGHGFRSFTIGDIDVVQHDGRYHLFHLVLPNHDYIAHAVSDDGLSWQRAPHAFFISDPGAFDDDMLWTMHVSRDPHRGGWRMFYTGLSQAESGRVQRVGAAHSDDLYHWTKLGEPYPLQIDGAHYEADPDRCRKWVSFRDPFWYQCEDGRRLLLACGRVNHGPEIRRGCVACAREVEPDRFEFVEPLHHPMRFDEIEVPSLFKLGGRYYLLGSCREDVKVRYWTSDELMGPYTNFFDNVLLPQGSYAARPSAGGDDQRVLLWSYFHTRTSEGRDRQMLLPPKRLAVRDDGRLALRSFEGFDERVERCFKPAQQGDVQPLMNNPHAEHELCEGRCCMRCASGFEGWVIADTWRDFRMTGRLGFEGLGKCGFIFRSDEQANGYYISLDLIKGLAQCRAWGDAAQGGKEQAFDFNALQSSNFVSDREGPWDFQLIAFGEYIEVSLNGDVVLALGDNIFHEGRVGFYAEGARIEVGDLKMEQLRQHDGYGFTQGDEPGESDDG